METQKPLLKDEDGKEVDVHMCRLMIGSLMYLTSSRPDIMFTVCACARYQVNPKVSHLYDVKMIFSDYAGASLDKKSTTGGCEFLGCKLISWQCKKQTVLWSTVNVKTINGELQLHALVDGKKIIITESFVRRDLQLADENSIDCLPNSTIFEQLALMGYEKCLSPKTTAWNEFSSTMASAIICLATNQKFNFSKLIFDSMIRNLDNVSGIMDDPDITMEEYIRLQEEKAQRAGRTFNWQTTTYGKVKYYEDEDDCFINFESEFLAIVFDDTSDATLSCEPTVSSLNNDGIDFRISYDESDDEDYTVIFDKNSFSYKIISANDLKTNSENDNEKVNMPLFSSPEPTISYFDDLDFFKDFENEFPAIVYNDALTDEKEQNVLYFNDLFSFNVIYPDDLKPDKDNDIDEIDIEQSSRDMSVVPLPNVINTDDGAYALRDLTERKEEIGGVFIIWNSRSVGVLTNLKEVVQHILARKPAWRIITSKPSGSFPF
ncbi:hypothetical protein Tco_0010230 [Tanacetum coccineum]